MSKPDWRNIALEEGILREPIHDAGRIVLWVPGDRASDHRDWERVSNVQGEEIIQDRGLSATPATAIHARQKMQGLVGKLLGRFQKAPEGQAWMLPSGETAVQSGARETNLMLVWADDANASLDESRLKQLYPDTQRVRKLGKNLFLMTGVDIHPVDPDFNPARDNCRDQVQQLLAQAQQSRDPNRELMAVIDMGLVFLRTNEIPRAMVLMDRAVSLARERSDRLGEADAIGNLALAVMILNQTARGAELLQQQLTIAREIGERYLEKNALDKLGTAYAELRDFDRAFASYRESAAVAQAVGDVKHEAELYWFMAIQYAELGQREQTIEHAGKTLTLFEKIGHPRRDVLQQCFDKYKSADTPASANGASKETMEAQMFRTALFHAKSAQKFFEAGLRPVSPARQKKRIEQCETCKYHTGARCRLAGFFTAVATWLPHESCPIAKWPS